MDELTQAPDCGAGQCSAPVHGFRAYNRYHCRCPEIVERHRKRFRDRARSLPRGHRRRGAMTGFDPVAVERAIGGEPLRLAVPEMRAAVGELTAAQLSAAQIAIRLGTTTRTVTRHRAALREQGVAA
jgi:hypothetical protein